jgi:hypothetical protein
MKKDKTPGEWCEHFELDEWGVCAHLFNSEIETCYENCLMRCDIEPKQ